MKVKIGDIYTHNVTFKDIFVVCRILHTIQDYYKFFSEDDLGCYLEFSDFPVVGCLRIEKVDNKTYIRKSYTRMWYFDDDMIMIYNKEIRM